MAETEAASSRSAPTTYTVTVRGEVFKLSEEQVRFDSPNYFSMAFFGDWAEGASKEITLVDRDPDLFRGSTCRTKACRQGSMY